MNDKAAFKKAFGGALSSSRFQRKGQSWYLHGPDCTAVLNLQKDDYSDLYYVNFGVWLISLGDDRFPQENHCQVRARLERLFPVKRELIYDACTIGPEGGRLQEFIEFVKSDVAKLCNDCLTEDGLGGALEPGRIPLHHAYMSAKIALGLAGKT